MVECGAQSGCLGGVLRSNRCPGARAGCAGHAHAPDFPFPGLTITPR